MYKRMLVPLDGSELAEVALPYAEELAKKLDSEVILINVRAPDEDPDNPEHRLYLSKMAATTEQNIRKSSDTPPGQKVKVVERSSRKHQVCFIASRVYSKTNQRTQKTP